MSTAAGCKAGQMQTEIELMETVSLRAPEAYLYLMIWGGALGTTTPPTSDAGTGQLGDPKGVEQQGCIHTNLLKLGAGKI